MLFLFFLFGLLHTCNCLLRTCSLRLTGKKYHWESTTFPRISILPVVKVRGSTILWAGGLQRKPGVDITVRKGVKYLEDQNRRYGWDKMPLLSVEFSNCVKARPNKYWTIRDKKYFPFGGLKKIYPFANFSILDFTRTTGTNSSLLSKMTFALKMTKFTIFSKAKEKYFLLHKYRSF